MKLVVVWMYFELKSLALSIDNVLSDFLATAFRCTKCSLKRADFSKFPREEVHTPEPPKYIWQSFI